MFTQACCLILAPTWSSNAAWSFAISTSCAAACCGARTPVARALACSPACIKYAVRQAKCFREAV